MTNVDCFDYSFYESQVTSRPDSPYFMYNRDIAEEFFAVLRESYPDAVYFDLHISQVICITYRAAQVLKSSLAVRIPQLTEEIQSRMLQVAAADEALMAINRMGVTE